MLQALNGVDPDSLVGFVDAAVMLFQPAGSSGAPLLPRDQAAQILQLALLRGAMVGELRPDAIEPAWRDAHPRPSCPNTARSAPGRRRRGAPRCCSPSGASAAARWADAYSEAMPDSRPAATRNLFDDAQVDRAAPLAARMRPRSLGEFAGQEHLVGEGRPLAPRD